MQIYFHSRLWSYLPRVPILVEGTVYIYIYIYVYIYIMFIPVLSLLCAIHVHAVATDVSLYTSYHSHAKMTEIVNTCGKT